MKYHLADFTEKLRAGTPIELPEDATDISLRDNFLSDVPIQALKDTIATISKHAKSFDLSNCELNKLAPIDASDILHSLKTVGTLNLSWNDLGTLTHPCLRAIFNGINKTVKSLNLSDNHLDLLNGFQLLGVLMVIRTEHLDLSSNHLAGIKSLALAFAQVQETVQSINLSDNSLGLLSEDELKELHHTLPYVKTVYLSHADVAKKSYPQYLLLKDIFPQVANVILLDDEGRVFGRIEEIFPKAAWVPQEQTPVPAEAVNSPTALEITTPSTESWVDKLVGDGAESTSFNDFVLLDREDGQKDDNVAKLETTDSSTKEDKTQRDEGGLAQPVSEPIKGAVKPSKSTSWGFSLLPRWSIFGGNAATTTPGASAADLQPALGKAQQPGNK